MTLYFFPQAKSRNRVSLSSNAAAQCRGVWPSLSRASRSAPDRKEVDLPGKTARPRRPIE